MKHNRLQFLWQNPDAAGEFRTGVCLHGHTFHSKECLSFLPRHLRRLPGVGGIVRSHEKRIDFARGYWTPPLSPASAVRLEREQIGRMGLAPLVSLTDHDDIDAGISLQAACERAETPVSVEWTAPFAGSIFHIGVHNFPPGVDRASMKALAEYTKSPRQSLLPALLEGLSLLPDTLVVLNHPFWLEEGVERHAHQIALARILATCSQWIHAFELNGTRPWSENRDVVALAERHARPIVSGGDRHACEPSACINLTNAASFAEFVAEVRSGQSDVLFLPHYREPMPSRILEAAWDILRPYPEYPDRVYWTDRFFYTGEDGVDRALSEVWDGRTPRPLRVAAGLVELFATTGLRAALRFVLPSAAENSL